MIPFLDLKKLNQRFDKELQSSLREVLENGQYINSSAVDAFEKEFAAYCGTHYCVGTASGLDALTLILQGYIHLGRLKKGDQVLVPSNTFIATIFSVIKAGLIPVLVSPDERSFNIDLKGIENSYSAKVRAVIVVHLYGQLSDTCPILDFCRSKDMLLIEDAAQAHGARNSSGSKAGSLGDAAAFSFYPSKNLGALGDSGAVTTNDAQLAEQVRLLGNYGSRKKYHYEAIGANSRLDEVQASWLRIKLKYLDSDNQRRRDIAYRYASSINNPKIRLPEFKGLEDHVFYVYVVRVDHRDEFINYLNSNQIESHIHYPLAPHLQQALLRFNFDPCPVSDRIHQTVVSIPLNPILTDEEVQHIIEILNAY
ncbi:MAG TPA: aminotransferase [Cytophagales bacterium]|jgi:dTDP-4-amino-4,6-dideoxygalactose transaminase|nr:aminotransferase [Cytophagales bacterium]